MKNESEWKPTKFDYTPSGLRGSRSPAHLSVSSRLTADLGARWMERAIPEHAHGRMLDLGCGNAPFYGLYRHYVSSVICIDWTNTPHSINYLDFEHDLTKPLPLADETLDTILLSSVIEHLPDPRLIWSEMRRILAPNGIAIIYVPFLYWLHETPHDYYRYTEFALGRFATESGFEILELTATGGAVDVVIDIISKTIIEGRGGSKVAGWLQSAALRFGQTTRGERLRQRTARKFPLAYGMIVRRPPPRSIPTASG